MGLTLLFNGGQTLAKIAGSIILARNDECAGSIDESPFIIFFNAGQSLAKITGIIILERNDECAGKAPFISNFNANHPFTKIAGIIVFARNDEYAGSVDKSIFIFFLGREPTPH